MLRAILDADRKDEEAVACVRRINDPLLGHQVDLSVQCGGQQVGMVSLCAKRAADMRRWAMAVLECAAKAEEAERAAAVDLDAPDPDFGVPGFDEVEVAEEVPVDATTG